MAGSVQPALRTAFLAPLRSALALDADFQERGRADFAWSSGLEQLRERVWTYGGRSTLAPVALRAGPTVLNESGEFLVFVEAVLPGEAVETALNRAYALAGIVVRQAAIHKGDLAVTGLKWILPGVVDFDGEGQTDIGAAARLRCSITYEARVEQP